MPIIFQFDEATSCVCSTAHGIVAVEEIEAHLRMKAEAQLLSKPEIFDARDVTLDLSTEDLKHIATVLREVMNFSKPGPTAVVTNTAYIECLARAYAAMTAKENPDFRVYNTIAEAKKWVASLVAKDPERYAPARTPSEK